jgi:murein DD-endopeptidase MepM/ murein hydrolase activator NlpD
MQRYIIHILLATCALSLTACGHFQGVGDFKSNADYAAESREPSSNMPSTTERQLGFIWPVTQVRITQGFEPAKNPRHKGIDIGGYRGMPITASQEGRVIYTGHGYHGYGNMVLIEHDGKIASLYGHLQRIKIRQGAHVKAGTLIGTMGRTGHATGVHLHFEIMRDRQPVDPLLFMNEPARTISSK